MSKIAIFFDAENVSSAKVPEIISYLSAKGDILVQRAYADWSIPATKSWRDQIPRTPITAIQQFHHNQEQAVDKAIMMDAIELAMKHEEIDMFVLVTSDNGYYSLSLRLRELGKWVIGIGSKKFCNPIWINSCNEFTYFEDLKEDNRDILVEVEDNQDESGLENFSLQRFLEKAFDFTPFYEDTNVKLLSRMCESILHLKPDFNTKNYGFKTAKELLLSFDKKFSLSDDGRPQRTFFVEKIENDNASIKKGIVKSIGANYGIISAVDESGDYYFHVSDVNLDFENENFLEKFLKGTKVIFKVERNPDKNSADKKLQRGNAYDVKLLEKK